MSLFTISSDQIDDSEIRFPEEESYHIHVILRKRINDKIECKDERGMRYNCVLRVSEKHQVIADIISISHQKQSNKTKLTLIFPVLKGGKTEWILQKGTELGVDSFIPFLYKRTVARPAWLRKEPRLRKIIHEACKQTERGEEPELKQLQDDPAAVHGLLKPKPVLKIICWEMERRVGIRELLQGEKPPPEHVAVAVGPEGGIEEKEIDHFRNEGFLSAGLGGQILRSETACLATAAMIRYEYCSSEMERGTDNGPPL